jgi:hypothetical protein
MAIRLLRIAVLCWSCTFWARGQSVPPASVDEIKYLRFLLMKAGSIDHSADSVDRFERGIVKQFGLDNQEAAAIHAAGQEMKGVLNRLRQSAKAVTTGKPVLAPSDFASLSKLAVERDAALDALANRILASVRPATAARLRAPGQILARKGIVKSGP